MTFDNTLQCLLTAIDIPSVKILTSYALSCLVDRMYILPWNGRLLVPMMTLHMSCSLLKQPFACVLQFTPVQYDVVLRL